MSTPLLLWTYYHSQAGPHYLYYLQAAVDTKQLKACLLALLSSHETGSSFHEALAVMHRRTLSLISLAYTLHPFC